MKLYSHPFSQHSRRVRMLCDELSLDIEIKNMSLETGEHKTKEFLDINPTGRVPVLKDGAFVLSESHAIMKYLATEHGAGNLYPNDAKIRANIDMWLDWNHTKLNPPIQALIIQTMAKGESGDPVLIETSRDQTVAGLRILDSAMASGKGPGDALSIADLSLASTVALYEMADGSLSDMPAVAKWFGHIKSRPSFTNTAPTPG